nr:carbohydrate sulfotransferase 1-like [Dermatophagoides farinae]
MISHRYIISRRFFTGFYSNHNMFIMEKQKIFLFLIAAGAIFILLQQSSQITTVNNHFVANNNNISSLSYNSSISIIKNHQNESKWSYDKLVRQLSKTFGSSSNAKSQIKDVSKQRKEKDHLRAIRHKYNFIEKFKIFNGNDQARVLIVAYFRSGSSFIGDLLQQNWKSFYTFEPLNYMTRQTRIDHQNLTEAINLISGVYNCDFSNNTIPQYYNQWIRNHTFLIRWNRFFWNICKFRTMAICYDNEFMSDVCIRSRYNIIKTVRLRIRDIEPLIRKMGTANNLKIIYLVRDPRGIYNSRKSMEWCNTDQCTNLTNICNDMRQDLNDFDRLKKSSNIGNNLLLVRYEDITSNPHNETRKLFENINVEFSQYIQRFLRTHTTNSTAAHHRRDKDKKNPYSTYRFNSTSTAWQWTKQLNKEELAYAQRVCHDVLVRLNYDNILPIMENSMITTATTSMTTTTNSNDVVDDETTTTK